MNPTVAAILGYTDDPQQQLAMAFGSRLEGGWTPPFPAGDHGTSFGPYQIHNPANPAAANDPVTATHIMGKRYAAGVRAAGGLWQSDPVAAADKAAVTAERPAQDYVISRGQPTVNAAFAAALNAIPQTSAQAVISGAAGTGGAPDDGAGAAGGQIGGSVTLPPQWSLNPATDAKILAGMITGIPGKVGDAVGGAFAAAFGAIWDDAKPFIVTMGFAGLGLALIGAGLVITTRPAREAATSKVSEAAPLAAAAAV